MRQRKSEKTENQEVTNEARAEAKISLTMPCKEEEGEASFTFVND